MTGSPIGEKIKAKLLEKGGRFVRPKTPLPNKRHSRQKRACLSSLPLLITLGGSRVLHAVSDLTARRFAPKPNYYGRQTPLWFGTCSPPVDAYKSYRRGFLACIARRFAKRKKERTAHHGQTDTKSGPRQAPGPNTPG